MLGRGLANQAQGASTISVQAARRSTPLAGAGVETTGPNVALAPIDDKTVLANISGDNATPVSNTVSDVIDTISSTQGTLLYRDSTGWLGLPPGANRAFLQIGGTGTNPVWVTSSGAVSQTLISGIVTPPTSTTNFTMAGLSGSITPSLTGSVLIKILGTITDNTSLLVNAGIIYQISHGTGTAPTSNSTLAGTQDGLSQMYTAPVAPTAAADVNIPFCISCLLTGLTVGTAYWIDLAQKAVTTVSQYRFSNVTVIATEI